MITESPACMSMLASGMHNKSGLYHCLGHVDDCCNVGDGSGGSRSIIKERVLVCKMVGLFQQSWEPARPSDDI